jgi:hypothetical protein
MDAPPVTEADILNPPADMLAAKAKIISTSIQKPLAAKPHSGFQLVLQVVAVTQGNIHPGAEISVAYGGCHNSPGNPGDIIAVLALRNPEGQWYAPQFWQRSAPAVQLQPSQK